MKLRRKHLFIFGIICILLFMAENRLIFLITGTITQGEIIDIAYIDNPGRYSGAESAPIIQFTVQDQNYRFEGRLFSDYKIGNKVKVIYAKGNPAKAYMFNFSDFWLSPFLWGFLLFIVMSAAVFSFFTSTDIITIHLWKRPAFNRQNNEEL